MNNGYVKSLMINIQMEYLVVLKALREKISKDNIYLFIDELKQFWIKRENKIEFVIENLLTENNVTFFTAATVLDLAGGDQYPFLLCGEYHIFDDPLFAHLETANQGLGNYSNFLYEKAVVTINDNIDIIESYSNLLWVVPIRLLYSSVDKEHLRNNMEDIFVSLFNNIADIDDYFSKCETIDDIEKYFNQIFSGSVQLTVNERYGMTLREKFTLVKEDRVSEKLDAPNDAVLFFIVLGGLIGQAIDIVYASTTSRLMPFIRYEPSYSTVMSIMGNFRKIDNQFIDMEIKITQYYLTQLFFDKNDFVGIDLNNYNNSIERLHIRQKLDNIEIKINQEGSFQKTHDEIKEILGILKNDLLPPKL